MEAIPIPIVDQVGVWNFGWMRAKWLGIALCTAIESEGRAVGRIVVCVEAEAEVRIVAANSTCRTWPTGLLPNTAGAMTENTSPELSGFASPMPFSPTPAKEMDAMVMSR